MRIVEPDVPGSDGSARNALGTSAVNTPGSVGLSVRATLNMFAPPAGALALVSVTVTGPAVPARSASSRRSATGALGTVGVTETRPVAPPRMVALAVSEPEPPASVLVSV